jgi:hypothetical protein
LCDFAGFAVDCAHINFCDSFGFVLVVYAAAAMLLAPLIFVTAEWIGHDDHPPGLHRIWYAVLAALLWPVLAVGVVQFAVIGSARRALRPRAGLISLGSDDSDTGQLRRLAGPYVGVGTPAT